MRRIIVFENSKGTKRIFKHLSHSRCVERIERSADKTESIADLNWVRFNPRNWSAKDGCNTSDAIFNGFSFAPMRSCINFVCGEFVTRERYFKPKRKDCRWDGHSHYYAAQEAQEAVLTALLWMGTPPQDRSPVLEQEPAIGGP